MSATWSSLISYNILTSLTLFRKLAIIEEIQVHNSAVFMTKLILFLLLKPSRTFDSCCVSSATEFYITVRAFSALFLSSNCLRKHWTRLRPNIIAISIIIWKPYIHRSTVYPYAAHLVCERLTVFSTFINGFPTWCCMKFSTVWQDQNFHTSQLYPEVPPAMWTIYIRAHWPALQEVSNWSSCQQKPWHHVACSSFTLFFL